ncbi:MAG: hypothetical protein KDC73_10365 [Ignavibacteriae bacterium]|nr:hypothetical protein [Ignavibacteriota bacterium]MCB9242576.1 hypothetical protein [Ignavibacteriales bacterium]
MGKYLLTSIFVLLFCVDIMAQCDTAEMSAIDGIVITAENNLLDAKVLNTTLEDGTGLTAFYVNNDLIKLTVDAKQFMQEIFVSGGYAVCFKVTSFTSDSNMYEIYYFKDNKLVCREDPMTGEMSGPPDEPETDLIAGFEYYLSAIQ